MLMHQNVKFNFHYFVHSHQTLADATHWDWFHLWMSHILAQKIIYFLKNRNIFILFLTCIDSISDSLECWVYMTACLSQILQRNPTCSATKSLPAARSAVSPGLSKTLPSGLIVTSYSVKGKKKQFSHVICHRDVLLWQLLPIIHY